MGLFDGAQDGNGSTADLATALNLPLILVVDGKGQSASMGALLHGFNSFREDTRLAGVIFNRVSSPFHAELLSKAASDQVIPALGYLPRLDDLVTPSRHLGLVQAEEHEGLEAFIQKAADIVTRHIDLQKIQQIVSPPKLAPTCPLAPPPADRIAIARDAAFNFSYPHILHRWKAAGAALSFFSPLTDERPAMDANFIYLPGGYPELHADKLANNETFKKAIRRAANTGIPIYGECGGYMTLGRGLIDKKGTRHEMLNLLPIETSFHAPKRHLGYRQAVMQTETPLGNCGQIYTAHEFHYASETDNTSTSSLFEISNAKGQKLGGTGAISGSVFGSFIHLIDRKGSI